MNSAVAAGFFSELEKISEKKEKKRKYDLGGAAVGVGTAYGVAGPRRALVERGARRIIAPAMDDLGVQEGPSRDELVRLFNLKTPHQYRDLPPSQAGMSMFSEPDVSRTKAGRQIIEKLLSPERSLSPGEAFMQAPNRSPALAHELGHMALREKALGRMVARAKMLSALPTAAAIGGAALQDPDKSGWAPAVGAAATLPLLADEAYASLKGYKGMRMGGASPAALRAARNALPRAFGTYLLNAGALAATPFIIRGARKAYKRHKEKR